MCPGHKWRCRHTGVPTLEFQPVLTWHWHRPCSDEKQRLWKWKIVWPSLLPEEEENLKAIVNFRWHDGEMFKLVQLKGRVPWGGWRPLRGLQAHHWQLGIEPNYTWWGGFSSHHPSMPVFVLWPGKATTVWQFTIHPLFNDKKLGGMFTRCFSMSLAWLDKKCEPMAAFFSPQKPPSYLTAATMKNEGKKCTGPCKIFWISTLCLV